MADRPDRKCCDRICADAGLVVHFDCGLFFPAPDLA